jgi:hypothetical protein
MSRRLATRFLGASAAVAALAWAAVSSFCPVAAAEPAPPADAFAGTVKPFLDAYCTTCHNETKNAAGVSLTHYTGEAHARKDRKVWESVREQIASGAMPPKKRTQPEAAERTAVLAWIDNQVLKVDCVSPKDPGRVTLRRLNRAEYNNTIRDLLGVDVKPADDFPSDDVGYGFDNIGDVLSLPPILLEKYLAAADRVLAQAIGDSGAVRSSLQRFGTQPLLVTPRSAKKRETINGREVRKIVFAEEGSAFIEKFHFPADGEYAVRVRAWGKAAGGEAPNLVVRVNGKDVKAFAVAGEPGKPQTYEARTRQPEGEFRVAAAFTNPAADKARELGVESVEVEGPIGGGRKPLTPSEKKILVVEPKAPAGERPAAEAILTTFARKAYRRPVTADETRRLMKLYDVAVSQGEPFGVALKLPLKAILVSPHFLFRVEADPANPNESRPLTDHELATRLSYFLWSTMPDEELSLLADAGQLSKPDVLAKQVRRMLKDPKVSALTENFAGQWLMLRSVRTLAPDAGTFPTWDEQLRAAIIRETELFFEHVVQEDRSVLEFLDADYTFANDRLAYHYGLPRVRGKEFRKVQLPDTKRGGVVTHASVLLVTSNPTRTSPVKRGKWVYENILGLTAPPPAPDVPELEKVALKGTLRQRMEQHRSNPACATCHAKLDPLGFGLENFDGIGKWRDADEGQRIDASGVLPDGAKFDGPAELRKVLLGKSDLFRRCLAEKLLTFALGRGLEYYDRCVVDDLVKKLKAGDDRFSALVLGIAESDPFRKRRGKRSE